MTAERQRLLLFYQSALNGQAGHPELWARDLQRVLAADGTNPYFRWFAAPAQPGSNIFQPLEVHRCGIFQWLEIPPANIANHWN